MRQFIARYTIAEIIFIYELSPVLISKYQARKNIIQGVSNDHD